MPQVTYPMSEVINSYLSLAYKWSKKLVRNLTIQKTSTL